MIGPGLSPLRSHLRYGRRPSGSGSPLDVITSSNGAYWVVAERGTNYVAASDDMSTSPWSVTRASYDQPAQKLIEDTTAAATHYIEGSVTLATKTTYTVSFEAKPAGRDWAALVLQSVGLSKIAYFDLANGTLGASNDEADATITAIGDGWYRCTLFDTTTSAGSGLVRVYLSNADADFGVLNGDGSSGIYLRHPQVEAGASFTAYEETTGTALGGALLDQTGGGRHLLLPGGTANPVLLDHTGTDYFWLPGTTGNYLSVPDSAALSVTGDIELQAFVSHDTWSAASVYDGLIGKWPREYALLLDSAGKLTLWASETGASLDVLDKSSVATGLSAGEAQWVKVTCDIDDGVGGRVTKFYLGGSDPSSPSWSQLGADVTGVARTGIYDGTNQVEIGQAHAYNCKGKVYRAIIKNGIDGTTVLDVRASDADPDATTFTEASSNAATVTINRSSTGYKTAVVDQPLYVFATDDYLSAADAAVFDVGASDSFSTVAVMRFHDYPATEGFVIGKRANLVTASNGWVVYVDSSKRVIAELSDGTVEQGGGFGGDFDINITNHLLQGYGAVRDVGSDLVYSYVEENALGSSNTDNTTGTLENAEPVEVGGAFYYSAVEFVGAAFIKGTAWDATELAEIIDALITANGGTP